MAWDFDKRFNTKLLAPRWPGLGGAFQYIH